MVVLVLRGCRPLFINQVHMHVVGNGIPSVKDPREFDAKVRSPDQAGSSCYCEAVQAILALRPEDCVFESLYSRLVSEQNLVYEIGLDFHLQEEHNGARRYSISRVHAALIDTGNRDLLLVRLIPTPLTMEVTSEHLGGPNGLWTAKVHLEPVTVTYIGEDLPPDKVLPYSEFDGALEEAHRRPEDAKRILETAAKTICRGGEYPALEDFIEGLDFDAWERDGKLRPELQKIRKRLWDAPAVAEGVRTQLEKQLKKWQPEGSPGDPEDYYLYRLKASPLSIEDAQRKQFAPGVGGVTGEAKELERTESLVRKLRKNAPPEFMDLFPE